MNPREVPSQMPVVAISTAPALPNWASQQPTVDEAVVVGILGFAHHVATRNGTPPSCADTICHGGTCTADGFDINCTPLDRVDIMMVFLVDFRPSVATNAWMSEGPPVL